MGARVVKFPTSLRPKISHTPGDIFAADVMYHRNCLSSYVIKFKRDLEIIFEEHEDQVNDDFTEKIIDEVFQQLNIQENAYHLSNIRDQINKRLSSSCCGKIFYFLVNNPHSLSPMKPKFLLTFFKVRRCFKSSL